MSFFASKRALISSSPGLDRGLEAGGVGEHVLELDLLGAPAELALHLGVAHRHRGAHQALQALPQELAAQPLLEVLLGEPLQLEAPADLLGADEAAVVLELGRGRDRARQRLVGDGDAEAPALELDQAVADEALEHLLFEPHLAQHVLVEPTLIELVVHLALAAVRPLELTDRDGQPAHRHHGLPRRPLPLRRQRGDVQDDEGGDHQPQEDVEPAPVAAHQGESHAVSSRTFAKSRFYAPHPPPASRAVVPLGRRAELIYTP